MAHSMERLEFVEIKMIRGAIIIGERLV